MTFRHKAIYGVTGMGKTWLCKRIIAPILKHKQKVIVFPGNGDLSFPKGVKYYFDVDELEEALQNPENFGSFVFIDEAMSLYPMVNRKKHPILYGATVRGRHLGYTFYFATQFPTSIPYFIRRNCAECYCFNLADHDSAETVYKDYARLTFNGEQLDRAILKLNKLEFFHIIHPLTVTKKTL